MMRSFCAFATASGHERGFEGLAWPRRRTAFFLPMHIVRVFVEPVAAGLRQSGGSFSVRGACGDLKKRAPLSPLLRRYKK